MKHPRRNVYAVLGVVAGAGLLYFEVMRRRESSTGEAGFWILVALLLIVFSLFELFYGPKHRE